MSNLDRDVLGDIQAARFKQTQNAKRKYYGGCTTSLPRLLCKKQKGDDKECREPINITVNVEGNNGKMCPTTQAMPEPGYDNRLAVRKAMGKQPGLENMPHPSENPELGDQASEHPENNNEFGVGPHQPQYQTSPSSGVGANSMGSIGAYGSRDSGSFGVGGAGSLDTTSIDFLKSLQTGGSRAPPVAAAPVSSTIDQRKNAIAGTLAPFPNPTNNIYHPPNGTMIEDPDAAFFPYDFHWFYVALCMSINNWTDMPTSTKSMSFTDLEAIFVTNLTDRWTLEGDEVWGYISKMGELRDQQEDPTHQHDVFDAAVGECEKINESVTTPNPGRWWATATKPWGGALADYDYHPEYIKCHIEGTEALLGFFKEIYDKGTESLYGRIQQFPNLPWENRKKYLDGILIPTSNLLNLLFTTYDTASKITKDNASIPELEKKLAEQVAIVNLAWAYADKEVTESMIAGHHVAGAVGRQPAKMKLNTTFKIVPNCVFWKWGKNTDNKCPQTEVEAGVAKLHENQLKPEQIQLLKDALEDKFAVGSKEGNEAALLVSDKDILKKTDFLDQAKIDKIKLLADEHTKEQIIVKGQIDTKETATLDAKTLENNSGQTDKDKEIDKIIGNLTKNGGGIPDHTAGGGFQTGSTSGTSYHPPSGPAAVPTLIPPREDVHLKPPPINTTNLQTPETALPPTVEDTSAMELSGPSLTSIPPNQDATNHLVKDALKIAKDAEKVGDTKVENDALKTALDLIKSETKSASPVTPEAKTPETPETPQTPKTPRYKEGSLVDIAIKALANDKMDLDELHQVKKDLEKEKKDHPHTKSVVDPLLDQVKADIQDKKDEVMKDIKWEDSNLSKDEKDHLKKMRAKSSRIKKAPRVYSPRGRGGSNIKRNSHVRGSKFSK